MLGDPEEMYPSSDQPNSRKVFEACLEVCKQQHVLFKTQQKARLEEVCKSY